MKFHSYLIKGNVKTILLDDDTVSFLSEHGISPIQDNNPVLSRPMNESGNARVKQESVPSLFTNNDMVDREVNEQASIDSLLASLNY